LFRNSKLLSTLDPSLLSHADHLDLSGKITHSPSFPAQETHRLRPQEFFFYAHACGPRRMKRPFPDNTHGFLYYHPASPAAPLGGSIRFRITPDPSPHSFRHGSDLLAPSGLPWRILLPQIACRKIFARLGPQLVRDGLVTEAQLSRCRDLFYNRGSIHPDSTVFSLDSIFLVQFNGEFSLTIVGAQAQKLKAFAIFRETSSNRRCFPWTGSAIARFEPSTLPEYAGRRVLHIRFLKMIEPVSLAVDLPAPPERVMRPEEGELFIISRYGQAPRPWAYDVDRPNVDAAAILRDLWENSRSP
ncbi:hypothetical protein B0H15DRAFT_785662, partial [Mycena belliarum]